MDDIILEKASFTFEADERRHSTRGKGVPNVVARTYSHAPPPAPEKKLVINPAPLGFFASAVTIFVFSLFNLHDRGITIENAGVGMVLFFGGICQIIAGLLAFAAGNTFAANGESAFTCYGGFWLAYSPFVFPAFGLAEVYANHPDQYYNALAMILAGWTILTTIFLIGTLRTNVVLLLFFLLLDVNLLILTIAEFTRSLTLQKIAGGEGLLFVAVAFYAGAANLLNEENCGFNLPVGNLARG